MKAVIMAGGQGTRLRPLTSNAPKPMLPVANRPMAEHIVTLLRQHGFDDIVVTVAFMANAIRTHFGDGSEFGVRMVYATEATPLGTAGSVRNAMARLDERFLVISGDVITDVDLTRLVAVHDERRALATIGLVRVDNPLEFGIVITRDDGSVDHFLEKPTWGQVFSDTINSGIYVLDPAVFDFIEPDRPSISPARCSSPCWQSTSGSTVSSWTATGRTSARSTPTCAPTRTSSTRRSCSRSPASGCPRAYGWGRGPRCRPRRPCAARP